MVLRDLFFEFAHEVVEIARILGVRAGRFQDETATGALDRDVSAVCGCPSSENATSIVVFEKHIITSFLRYKISLHYSEKLDILQA